MSTTTEASLMPNSRAKFEAWATKNCYPIERSKGNPESYEFLEVRRMWQGWQAALAALSQETETTFPYYIVEKA